MNIIFTKKIRKKLDTQTLEKFYEQILIETTISKLIIFDDSDTQKPLPTFINLNTASR